MSSAAEADLGALFINCREAIPERNKLEEMGHKQPPTPMQMDNTTALGIVTNNIASKRLKSMDMRLHWLRCRAAEAQFRHYWRPGPTNKAKYVTKHHVPIHHTAARLTYLTPKQHGTGDRTISYQKRGCKGGMIIFRVCSNSTLNGHIRSKGVLDLPVTGTAYV